MAIDLPILLRAYAAGLFPMADDRSAQSVFWVQPERRAVLPLDGFHLSRSLRKLIRSDRFTVTSDKAFDRVIALCAESAEDRPTTWINDEIEEAFLRLHKLGMAHSVECWDADGVGEPRLVGGLYGLSMGRAFFGESMFSRASNASKVAMAWLVARMRAGRMTLLDCQFMTSHLASLGAVELNAPAYSALLDEALEVGEGDAPDWGALDSLILPADSLPPGPSAGSASTFTVSGPVSGQLIVQLITQTS